MSRTIWTVIVLSPAVARPKQRQEEREAPSGGVDGGAQAFGVSVSAGMLVVSLAAPAALAPCTDETR